MKIRKKYAFVVVSLLILIIGVFPSSVSAAYWAKPSGASIRGGVPVSGSFTDTYYDDGEKWKLDVSWAGFPFWFGWYICEGEFYFTNIRTSKIYVDMFTELQWTSRSEFGFRVHYTDGTWDPVPGPKQNYDLPFYFNTNPNKVLDYIHFYFWMASPFFWYNVHIYIDCMNILSYP